MADYQPPKSPTLLPPRKSVELEDPGARGLESDEEDVFSDARDDNPYRSAPSSPIPRTRVEKVDDQPSHGQVPGTAAYQLRTEDAEPDEIAVIPEVGGIRCPGRASKEQPASPRSPGGRPIPKMVIERVDGTSIQDDMSQTAAREPQSVDAVPKVILGAVPPGKGSSNTQNARKRDSVPIPTTIVTKVDGEPSHGEVPHTDAYNKRTMDAEPDVVEEKGDVPGWPTSSLNRSTYSETSGRRPLIEGASSIAADGGFGPMEYDESDDADGPNDQPEDKQGEGNDDFGDEFDEFEEGAPADDDFGDFDDGFQQPEEKSESEPQSLPAQKHIPSTESQFPLIDFSTLTTLDDILAATSPHLSALFPSTASKSPLQPPTDPPPPLLTDRSLSLWTQLIAPPPLQPPNWVRSRIRRLFLVSLGVPVDLDEILPASKQKKLILPFTPSTASLPPEQEQQPARKPSPARPKPPDPTNPTKPSSSSTTQRKRKGPPPPPELDLSELRTLCTMTDTALLGLSNEELMAHVRHLEDVTARAGQVLEYWLRRKDAAVGEREAFEGVIESLVRHARRVRVKK